MQGQDVLLQRGLRGQHYTGALRADGLRTTIGVAAAAGGGAEEAERPVEALRIEILIAVAAGPRSEVEGVGAVRHRARVGELEVLGLVVTGRQYRYRRLVNSLATLMPGKRLPSRLRGVALELEARLVHQVGGENRGLGDHQILAVAARCYTPAHWGSQERYRKAAGRDFPSPDCRPN